MNYEDHIKGLGMLVHYFHALEFALRAVLKNQKKGEMQKVAYSSLKAGDTVPEDPMTNYDSMGSLIDKYNKLASKELKIDRELVTVRDALAHGRVFSDTPNLPMRLFKFGNPKNGMAYVAFAVTLDQAWFASMSGRRRGQPLTEDKVARYSSQPPLISTALGRASHVGLSLVKG